jgi:2-succinyl-5-enolpyruvyl-6-hydroxy-3-cyclohexene-1-carboxylate synthase
MTILELPVGVNHSCASAFIESLIACGVDDFVICPGSRNTPLVAAIDANPNARKKVHFDERGAGFYALGIGKGTAQPACLVVTSGTAAANVFPALIEARMDRVPLIVITADRPQEMVGLGHNQTINQLNLFGSYPIETYHLPPPDSSISTRYYNVMAANSYRKALDGPVHVNFAFREPFEPEIGRSALSTRYVGLLKGHLSFDEEIYYEIDDVLHDARKGLILVGKLDDSYERDLLKDFIANYSWPVFCDATSSLNALNNVNVYPYYDQMLTSNEFIQQMNPDIILHFGGRMNSKNLHSAIQKWKLIAYAHVNSDPDCLDPDLARLFHFQVDIKEFCSSVNLPDLDSEYIDCIAEADKKFQGAIKGYLEINRDNIASEVALVLAIAQSSCSVSIFAGTSMPIRLFNAYFSPKKFDNMLYANRGASGIDGLLATAVGIAEGTREELTLIIGDTSLLHDLNSLALLKNSEVPVKVILFNNNGGSIFKFLPIGNEKKFCETYCVAPHGFKFKSASEMFGIKYVAPKTMDEFRDLLNKKQRKSMLIELFTDGDSTKEDMEMIRKQWLDLMR